MNTINTPKNGQEFNKMQNDIYLELSDKPLPYIVCAAIRSKNDPELIICGARHFDSVMRSQLKLLDQKVLNQDWDQGFIDQFGNYYNRQDAWFVAEEQKQIKQDRVPHAIGTLYSEHLY